MILNIMLKDILHNKLIHTLGIMLHMRNYALTNSRIRRKVLHFLLIKISKF